MAVVSLDDVSADGFTGVGVTVTGAARERRYYDLLSIVMDERGHTVPKLSEH